MKIFNKFFKDPNEKEIEKLQPIVEKINAFEPEIEKLSDDELKAKTAEFKKRLEKETLAEILPEAFAVVREASKRTIKMRHYDVQLLGGIILHQGQIAEMRTGEGKTLAATLPLYLNALEGRGAHCVTVNDYLARRDCGWMAPVYDLLGLSASVIVHEQSLIYDPEFSSDEDDERLAHFKPVKKTEAYAADITYGTNNEFGFDYLRDNMVADTKQIAQKFLHYAIVDEIDSILVDEARTPLIISMPAEESAQLYQKFSKLVPSLQENQDYNIDEKMRAVSLTDDGIMRVEKILGLGNIYTEGGIHLVHHLEQALRANTLFKRDRDYVVQDGEVVIIDEFTGRMMQGRRYSEGLHQAIEAKENVDIKQESRTLATVTFQNFFRMYEKLSGMTGTAVTEAEEFAKIYNLEVLTVPTNKPMVRNDQPDKIFSTEMGKFKAVIAKIKELHQTGQPVLIGTISIEKNELLSKLLDAANVPHEILNAKNHAREAQIIAQAGKKGAVTLATNMAGRGVDIVLGAGDEKAREEILAVGGLFILGTERHEARRIDNQLRGRAGRQGDPGVSQFFISMEDDLMRVFGSDRMRNMMKTLGVPEDQPIENKMVSRAIESAQHRVEGYNFDIRKHLVEYDDVLNKQRETVYRKRLKVLKSADKKPEKAKQMIMEMIEDEIDQIVSFHTANEDQTKWDLREIAEVFNSIVAMDVGQIEKELKDLEKLAGDKQQDAFARTAIIEFLIKKAKEQYDVLEKEISEAAGEAQVRLIEREVLIRSIDNLWVEHLSAINMLRTGIGLRGYGQRDPLIEYKKEAYTMFTSLMNLINKQVVHTIYKVRPGIQMARSVMQSDDARRSGGEAGGQFSQKKKSAPAAPAARTAPRTESGQKVGRNDPCPCGSGKKHKKCCGK